jgi:hypothetical protein
MVKLVQEIKNRYSPLQIIIGLGILFRLLAVIFSKGFGWFDDHFLVIEAAQSWVDGYDYNYWLPDPEFPDRQPQGHPMFYVGLHYLIFKFFSIIGFNDPEAKMFVIRFLHAAWSLLIITYGYKIAERLSNVKTATCVALFLSLFWFMPFLSVRNLVEFVCVPPLLMATWLFLKDKKLSSFLMGGIWIGIAFSIRFQSLFYSAGMAMALLIYRTQIKYLLSAFLGFASVLMITQCAVDYIIWGRIFAEFGAYVQYNIDNASVYGTDIWHMYLDLILGLLIPPLSIVLFIGWLTNWKKLPILFWPVLIYLAFHTYFPNKQERFVVTILPTLIIIGTIGMFEIYEKFKKKISSKLIKRTAYFVAGLNIILLLLITITYSKRNRVESMNYLRKQPDLNMVMIEDSNQDVDFTMPPLYYLGKWHSVIGVTKNFYIDSTRYWLTVIADSTRPNYAVFWQAENIETRVDSFRKLFPKCQFLTTIEPSLIDKTLHWLNPNNNNETAYIYKLNE